MSDIAIAVLKGIWRGIGIAAVAGMLGLAALVLVIPVIGGATPLTVLTGSMEPGLPPGTLVVVKPTPADEIRLGDVITYQMKADEPDVVTHRVVEVRSLSDGTFEFITMGDANDAPDPKAVVEAQVKGEVWYSVPFIGWITTGLLGQYRAWLLPLAGAALVLFGLGTVVSTVLDARRKRRQKAAAAGAADDLGAPTDPSDPLGRPTARPETATHAASVPTPAAPSR